MELIITGIIIISAAAILIKQFKSKKKCSGCCKGCSADCSEDTLQITKK